LHGGIPSIGSVFVEGILEIKVVKATKQKVLKVRSKFAEKPEEETDNNETK